MAFAGASGGAMLPVLFVSRYERRLAQLRAENPELGEERLTGTAFASALTDTGLERLEVLIAGGKLPAVRGALGKLGGGAAKMEGRLAALTGRAAAVGQSTLRGGIRGSAATGTELLQNVAPEGWKSLAAALQEDIKGADWDTVIAREEAALGDTALVSFGFVAVFGVGRRAVNYIDEGSLRMLLTDPHAVGLTGLSPVDVKRVIETAQHDSAAAADLAKQAADTTPVAERRERLLIVQEQMMQEQPMGQTAMKDGNPADPGDFTIPADSDPQFEDLGDPGDPGAVWADAIKLQQLIDQTQAAGRFNIFDEGAESVVYPLGKNWVLKKVNGLMDNTLPRWANVRHDKEALVDRVETIRALDGLKTYAALASGGELLIVQERGTPVTPEDYKSIVLKEKGDPAKQGKFIVTIRGRRFLVSDLHDGNFLKDKNGVIRVSDLLSGEIKNAGNTLWNAGQTPPDLDSKSK
ncbi:hypothetical protein [Luteolibacter sp. Populi]|uniref:hypothetical protein n=1 Tax=Luteolibacter sp. Populi TaxID=3230487 RepID=UPI0034660CCD